MHNKIKKGVALLLAIFMCSLMWMHVNAEVVNEKTFTVTTRPVDNQSAEETTVGQYDTFHDAIEACKQGNLSIQYIVTMNKDYTIPASEEVWYIQNANILLCSKEGQQYTLKRTGQRSLATIYQNCDFRTENIILDGNNEAEAFFVPYGVLTLGKGTIFQHFSNYIASDGPAIYVTNTGTVNIMEGAIIRNNKSDLKSAAVLQLNNPESTVNVYGGEFYNNNSTYWGGVFLSWGKINIMGGTFKDNYAQATGGVIASYGGVVNITGGNFANNLSAETGGVILFKGEDLNISNAAFTENSANKHGGAIYMKAGKLAIRDSVFTKNSSEHGGGALLVHYDNSNKLEVVSSRFEENSASFGGGIYLMSGSKLNVEGTQFINNDTGHGAAIATLPSLDVAADPSQLTVMNSQFQENVAWSGAGIFTSFPTKIEGCLFKANEALVADGDDQLNPHKTGTGGALSIMNNITQISKSDFVENKAYDSGGAICINGYTWNDDGTVEVKEHIGAEIKNNTKFLANSVEVGQGGAIYVAPYEYAYRIKDTEAYKNLKTDETTYFNGNKSGEGLFNPATNCGDFANLQFSENSDVTHEILR
jgi:predicted outer membrane repeat protein